MAHFLLGEVYLYKGEAQSAIVEFRKELEISPALWLVYSAAFRRSSSCRSI